MDNPRLLTDVEISQVLRFDPEVKVGAQYQELKERAICKAQAKLTQEDTLKAVGEDIKGVPNPYSKEIFTNSLEDISKFLKSKGLNDMELSSVSGVLARLGWENAMRKSIEVIDELRGEFPE